MSGNQVHLHFTNCHSVQVVLQQGKNLTHQQTTKTLQHQVCTSPPSSSPKSRQQILQERRDRIQNQNKMMKLKANKSKVSSSAPSSRENVANPEYYNRGDWKL